MVLKYQFQTLLTLRAPEIILLPPSPCTVVIWNYDVIVIVVLKCRPSGCLGVSPVSLKIWMKMASLLLFEVNNWHILILTVVCVIYMWSETHISGLRDTTIEIEKFPIFLMSWKLSAFCVFLSRNSLKSLQPAPCLNFSFIWKKNISWWKKKKGCLVGQARCVSAGFLLSCQAVFWAVKSTVNETRKFFLPFSVRTNATWWVVRLISHK